MAHSQLTVWQQIWSRRVRRALIFGSLNSENEVGAIHNDVSGERWPISGSKAGWLRRIGTNKGEGVQNFRNLAGYICEWPLVASGKIYILCPQKMYSDQLSELF